MCRNNLYKLICMLQSLGFRAHSLTPYAAVRLNAAAKIVRLQATKNRQKAAVYKELKGIKHPVGTLRTNEVPSHLLYDKQGVHSTDP